MSRKLSTLARLVAQQAGQSIEGRAGSGPAGQVLARDLLALGEAAETAAEARAERSTALAREVARQAAVTLPVTAGAGERILARDLVPAEAAGPAPASPPAPERAAPARAASALPAHDLEPPDRVRRIVAERLGASKREAPHYYMTVRCRTGALEALRATLNAERAPEARISLNDLLVKLAARALAETPALNAAWTERGIARFRSVDVGVAVAGPAGLLTPVVRDADTKRIGEISALLRELTAQARAGTLAREAYEGGTFTVSNLGMLGVSEFAAILDPPQAAILAIGAAEPTPVAVDGAVRVEGVMACTLSVDHRVADGVDGASYLDALRTLVEEPRRLLL